MDSRDEFYNEIKECQIVTYNKEFFADCFSDNPPMLKAVNVQLYHINQSQRPTLNEYSFTWEDVPRSDEEKWLDFCKRVNKHLKKFLKELLKNTNAYEGGI